MTHPEELLAGYVDGTLLPPERVAVDTHLSSCDRCRREVALAAAARRAVGALADVPAPAGVASRALEEAGAIAVRGRDGVDRIPRTYRFAAVVAAVAAVALVLLVVLPKPRGTENDGREAAAARGGQASETFAGAGAQALEIQDTDYDAASLETLANRSKQATALASPTAADAAAAPRFGTYDQTGKALACLQRGAPDAGNGLTRLIQARFQGTPAYVAVFLQGPGANQPPDKVTVWVVAKKGCRILSFVQAKI
jgi:hypothetical protein